MTDEEKLLHSARLRGPSDRLNRRMDQLFDGVQTAKTNYARPGRWVIVQVAAAALLGACAGWLLRPVPDANPAAPSTLPAVHYILLQQPNGWGDVFDWTQYPAEARPVSLRTTEWRVVTLPPAPGKGSLETNSLSDRATGNEPTEQTL